MPSRSLALNAPTQRDTILSGTLADTDILTASARLRERQRPPDGTNGPANSLQPTGSTDEGQKSRSESVYPGRTHRPEATPTPPDEHASANAESSA